MDKDLTSYKTLVPSQLPDCPPLFFFSQLSTFVSSETSHTVVPVTAAETLTSAHMHSADGADKDNRHLSDLQRGDRDAV